MLVINKKSCYNIPIANYKIQNKEGGYMMKIKRRIIGVILVAISTVMGVYLGGWLLLISPTIKCFQILQFEASKWGILKEAAKIILAFPSVELMALLIAVVGVDLCRAK